MRGHRLLLAAAVLAVMSFDQRAHIRALSSGNSARHVILVVSDGLRWQEVFRGADSTMLFAAGDNADALRRRYWRPSVMERRAALMPFVWGTLAERGQLRGNRDVDSRVDVTNAMKFSYPGYNEMLTGRPDPRIDRNDYGPNPNVTVFEWLNTHREFRGRVAAFGTWDTFRDIFNVDRSGIDVRTSGAKPDDIVVQQSVLPYLRDHRPRALFVGFAETDDWGHEGRYDRFLDAAHAVDRYLGQLWSAVQSDARYRNRTTLIFAADHGRGRTASDWMHHGREVDGAEESFIVVIGPDIEATTAIRGSRNVLGDVARLVAAAVGVNSDGRSCPRWARC